MFRLLRRGDTGPLVEYLQSTLNKLGFNVGEVDGVFGDRTYNAVLRFQRTMGLTQDGIVGPATWQALMPYMQGYIKYTIRSGDTFYRLAQEYNTSINAIQAANPGLDPLNLQVGTQITLPVSSVTIPTNISYSYDIMMFNIESLLVRFPFLRRQNIGSSVLGNNLVCIQMGTGPKEVSYNASHHGNEWITTVVLMKFIEQFCNAYVNGGTIAGESAQEIFNTCSIYLVPMVNPDGVNLVTGWYDEDSEPYKSARALNQGGRFPEDWSANIVGVDLNNNYPAEWEEARRIKFALGYTSPRQSQYVGPYPLSEPETQAMAAFTQAHNFRLILAYHSQGELIYWQFLNYNPPNSREIADAFARVSGYSVEQTPLNSAYAGYKDWFIQENNLPGYTIEVGLGRNPLPISQFNRIYNDNVGILVLGAVLAN